MKYAPNAETAHSLNMEASTLYDRTFFSVLPSEFQKQKSHNSSFPHAHTWHFRRRFLFYSFIACGDGVGVGVGGGDDGARRNILHFDHGGFYVIATE